MNDGRGDMWSELRETDSELWREAKEAAAGSPTVIVFCDDGHRRRKVETYTLDERAVWRPRSSSGNVDRLIDDDVVEPRSVAAVGLGRDRHRLVCSSCRLTIPVRGERLQRILTVVFEAVDSSSAELSLRGLGAVRLSR